MESVNEFRFNFHFQLIENVKQVRGDSILAHYFIVLTVSGFQPVYGQPIIAHTART